MDITLKDTFKDVYDDYLKDVYDDYLTDDTAWFLPSSQPDKLLVPENMLKQATELMTGVKKVKERHAPTLEDIIDYEVNRLRR